jgi:hypothetical protein
MRSKKHILTIFGILLVLSFALFSCSTSKKTAVSCPAFSINKNNKLAVDHKRNKVFISHYRATARKHPVGLPRMNQKKEVIVLKNSPVQDDFIATTTKGVSALNKIEYSKGLIASIDNSIIPLVGNDTEMPSLKKPEMTEQPKVLIITQPSGCDTIVLKSGSLLIGKVEEIGQNEIKYRACNNLTGPIISILKSEVSEIKYTNGTRDFITSTNALDSDQTNATISVNDTPIKTEGLSIAGFVSGLVGLFIAGIILGLLGVIFGVVGLSKIKNQPKKFKGKVFAIASIIIGAIAFFGAIIVIAVTVI